MNRSCQDCAAREYELHASNCPTLRRNLIDRAVRAVTWRMSWGDKKTRRRILDLWWSNPAALAEDGIVQIRREFASA